LITNLLSLFGSWGLVVLIEKEIPGELYDKISLTDIQEKNLTSAFKDEELSKTLLSMGLTLALVISGIAFLLMDGSAMIVRYKVNTVDSYKPEAQYD